MSSRARTTPAASASPDPEDSPAENPAENPEENPADSLTALQSGIQNLQKQIETVSEYTKEAEAHARRVAGELCFCCFSAYVESYGAAGSIHWRGAWGGGPSV